MSITHDWGSTAAERAAGFPCDALIANPDDVLFRAISVAAPPAVVFRWLCQLRVAPYSYDLLDNLGRTSPRTLTPGMDRLARGQPLMTIFELVEFERDHHLTAVLRLARGVFGDIAATYRVTPGDGADGAAGSRIVVKLLVKRPRGPMRLFSPLLPAGDLVMMRKQLRTLKQLAEQS